MFLSLKNKLHYLFLPHESNNFKAKTLHNSYIVFYLVLLLVFQTFANIIKKTPSSVLGYATDITIEKILILVNYEREKVKAPSLILSQQLSEAATLKAEDMFSKNYWAHVSPIGTTPWEFIKKSGYDYIYAGENLAKDFDYAYEVVEAWMKSPTHRDNILKPEYKDIGLAIMNGKLNGAETTLIVQEFGSMAGSVVKSENLDKKIETSSAHTSIQNTINKDKFTYRGVLSYNATNIWLILNSSKNVSLLVAEFLLVVSLLDAMYIWKHRIYRVSSHSFSHIILLIAVLGAMGATGIGVIL